MQLHHIAFRVDGGRSIGSGHVVRCMTLARELQALKCETRFIMRETDGNLGSWVEQAGFEVSLISGSQLADVKTDLDTGPLPAQTQLEDARLTLVALENWYPDWVVVDHYGLGMDWERELSKTGTSIFAIDDLANRHHQCDVLLDVNYFETDQSCRYELLVPSNCRRLIGPRFALLQPEYASIHATLPIANGKVRRILVFFGGSDSSNQSSNVISALSAPDLSYLAVDLVLGFNNSHIEQITALSASRGNVNIHQNLATLAELTARADFAIGAGGFAT